MAEKTYQQLLQELLDELGPDEDTIKATSIKARQILDPLGVDTLRIAFPNDDVAYALITAKFREEYGYKARVIRGRPGDKVVQLATRIIGCAPGFYTVWVVWSPVGVDVYFAQINTCNLRDSE